MQLMMVYIDVNYCCLRVNLRRCFRSQVDARSVHGFIPKSDVIYRWDFMIAIDALNTS